MKKQLALGMAVVLGATSLAACSTSQPAATEAATEAAAEAAESAEETEAAAEETEAEVKEPEMFHGEEVWLPFNENLEKETRLMRPQPSATPWALWNPTSPVSAAAVS